MALRQTMLAAAIILALLSTADARPKRHHRYQVDANGSGVVANPVGCPRVAFCACGAAVRIFGRPIRSLWPARAWFRFPKAYPAPGMAAVRNHHVMVLESHVSGDVWTVYDANSGHHLTRVHQRSITGYRIVNPNAGA